MALGIVVKPLLERVVDADRVDAGGARLHLALAPMDPGFVVNEQAGQLQTAVTPGQPELIARHRLQHRPHAEVEPAALPQRAHAGIHKRQAGLPRAPRLQTRGIGLPQPGGAGMQLAEFQIRLILEFLHEMAMPVQPLVKALQGQGPAAIAPLGGQLNAAGAGCLHHLPQRQGAPTEMGRQA